MDTQLLGREGSMMGSATGCVGVVGGDACRWLQPLDAVTVRLVWMRGLLT